MRPRAGSPRRRASGSPPSRARPCRRRGRPARRRGPAPSPRRPSSRGPRRAAVPAPSWNSPRTRWPGSFGAIIDTSTSAGGTICPKRMLKPCANMSVFPVFRYGAVDSSYSFFWRGSGVRIMTTAALFAASSTLSTVSPSPLAFAADFDVACNPTTTETPLSRRFSACACPWLPYPMIATVRPLRREMSASLSYQIVAIVLLLFASRRTSGSFFYEGEEGLGLSERARIAGIRDRVHVDESHQLLSEEIRGVALRVGSDREVRRAPLSRLEEKTANGRALPAENRFHPRQETRDVIHGDVENLFHYALPLRFFSLSSSSSCSSLCTSGPRRSSCRSTGRRATWGSSSRSARCARERARAGRSRRAPAGRPHPARPAAAP